MSIKFPFKFHGFIDKEQLTSQIIRRQVRLIPLNRASSHLGLDVFKNFSKIYTNVLQALADFDYEYLSAIMEPHFYKKCKESLQELQDQNKILRYVSENRYEPDEEDSEDEIEGVLDRKTSQEKDMFLGIDLNKPSRLRDMIFGPTGTLYQEPNLHLYLEAKGAYGVDIDRSKNEGVYKKLGDDYSAYTIYLNKENTFKRILEKQVLILNVYFFTTRKLILTDENGEILEGTDDVKTWQDHKFRFETYGNEIDWVLCDIDDFLAGNPYLDVEKTSF